MSYYLGKGTEFKKEECKEYKTLKNVLAAAAKDDKYIVWDEDGKVIGGLTDNVPDRALNTNPDGSVPAFDADGKPAGTVNDDTVAEATGENAGAAIKEHNETGQEDDSRDEEENCRNKNDTEQCDTVMIPEGTVKATVICSGTLNLRRTAQWGNDNICGRAASGQQYYVKAVHTVQGRKMIQTIDNIFLSGESEHVKLESM
ncbi:MAG: hypothetical protein NC123_18515 [Butyrivibrio sp.]|nr:hypothetical protein [Butyrivibrio sp.]